jgi:hypothetical protein
MPASGKCGAGGGGVECQVWVSSNLVFSLKQMLMFFTVVCAF